MHPVRVMIETRPAALCSCILVLAFMETNTMRKSGYLASVVAPRPVPRSQDSCFCCSLMAVGRQIFNAGAANSDRRTRVLLSPSLHAIFGVAIYILQAKSRGPD